MKSSANAALASLQHKFKAKIVEVGKLKNELKAVKFGQAYGARTEGAKQLSNAGAQILSQLTAIDVLKAQLVDMEAARDKHCIRANTAERLLRDRKSSVENWKSLAVVLCIVGVVLGGLSHYAYVLNVPV